MKRLISLCLALSMACSMFSLPAVAEEAAVDSGAEMAEPVLAEEDIAAPEAAPEQIDAEAALPDATGETAELAVPSEVPAEETEIPAETESELSLDTVDAAPIALRGPATHTEAEIIAKYMATSLDYRTAVTYAVQPDPQGYSTAGAVSNESLQAALNTVNLVRYVAGLNGVSLNGQYNTYAQYASTLSAAMNAINHTPAKPAGCPDDFYKIAYTGTSSSNLGWGYSNLNSSIISGYMDDSSSSNINRVGHRRWILNPAMGQIGFGFAKSTSGTNYTATYAFDRSYTPNPSPQYVAWPAAITPYDLWSGPLSFQFYASGNITNASATVASALEGKTYTFDESSNGNGTGVFYTNMAGYSSMNGCIIFGKKGNEKFQKDDTLTVTVKYTMGSQNYATTYTVSLLDMETAQRRGFISRLYDVCLNRQPDAGGMAYWLNELKTKSGSEVASGFVFSNEFKAKNYCNTDYIKQLYRAFMGRGAEPAGLKYWQDQFAKGTKREEVFNGFAASNEFKGICASYGIAVGNGMAVPDIGTVARGTCSACGAADGVTGFITRMYKTCLNRTPDATGIKYWCDKLYSQTTTGRDAAHGFVFSDEFVARKFSNDEFLNHLYEAFMDRKADAGGKKYWLDKIAAGATREDVFNGFVESNEFTGICGSYGITRG